MIPRLTPPVPAVKTTSINISPAVGWAVKDNLIIGADISYAYSKYINYYPQQQENRSYDIGLFVRRYKELGKGFYFFGQARAGVSYDRQEYDDLQQPQGNSLSKGYTVQVSVYPGIAYGVGKKFQLEAGFNNLAFLEFDHARVAPLAGSGSPDVANGFSIGSSLSNFSGITLGFYIFLN